MPFGHNCEHANFDACVRTMTGKVDDPKGYCAVLMRETESKCKKQSVVVYLDGLKPPKHP